MLTCPNTFSIFAGMLDALTFVVTLFETGLFFEVGSLV